ncbi:MAG: 50S ribosomal protein L3 [Desulfobulbia bacterium]
MPKTMGILGKKLGMTRVYDELGVSIPVTVVEAGPCTIIQVKTTDQEGYNAIQVGFDSKKASRVSKPAAGHFKKAGADGFYFVREFRVEDPATFEVGQELPIDSVFKVGDLVDVQGRSKGRGFQGVMKRHGFKGGGAGHGSGFHRKPGSIGCSAWPARVIKGKKMPGQMGNDTILKKNIIVVDIRPEDNVVLLKGPVPGAKNGLLKIFSK